jgi:hypothetical protein
MIHFIRIPKGSLPARYRADHVIVYSTNGIPTKIGLRRTYMHDIIRVEDVVSRLIDLGFHGNLHKIEQEIIAAVENEFKWRTFVRYHYKTATTKVMVSEYRGILFKMTIDNGEVDIVPITQESLDALIREFPENAVGSN